MKRKTVLILIGVTLIVSGVVLVFDFAPKLGIQLPDNGIWGLLVISGGFITLLAALNEATEFIQKIFPDVKNSIHNTPYDIRGPANPRNRQNVITNVRDAWVKGVLENNLQDVVRLELGLEDVPETLARPNLQLRFQNQLTRVIPPNLSIRQIFEDSGQALLILGMPGAGKTIIMLELARDLLDESELDLEIPVPIVLNLSSWGKDKPSIEKWLSNELRLQYQLAEKVTRAWLEHDQICLLLDGLDEVAKERRDDCVQFINEFKAQHSIPIVVCSRLADYDVLTTRLNLSRAIEIQPLADNQVEEFLASPELQLQAVRATLKHDPDLRELATTPLFLHIMTMAYRGITLEELGELETKEKRRYHLFNTYIRRILHRGSRPLMKNFSAKTSLGWLVYIAHHLTNQGTTAFFIEQLQIDWLPVPIRRVYRILVGFVFGLLSSLVSGAYTAIVVVQLAPVATEMLMGGMGQLVFGSIMAAISGITIGMITGLADSPIFPSYQISIQRARWKNLRQVVFLGIRVGIYVILSLLLLGSLLGSLYFFMIVGLNSIRLEIVIPVVSLGILPMLLGGPYIMLYILIIFVLDQSLVKIDSQVSLYPNQAINQSAKKIPLLMLLYGFVFALGSLGIGMGAIILGVINTSLEGFFNMNLDLSSFLAFLIFLSPVFGLGIGICGGIIFGFIKGIGETVTRHYILRFLLYWGSYLPLNLQNFLDSMVTCTFLRRIGGGYIFIHRTLQEHFALLTTAELDALATDH